MRLQFVGGRDGLPLTYCNGKVAFPDKRGPRPAIGSTWNCEILGENPRGTVVFLRLVSEVNLAAEEAAFEAAKKAAAEAKKAEAEACLAIQEAKQAAFQAEFEKAPFECACERTYDISTNSVEITGGRDRHPCYRFFQETAKVFLLWRSFPVSWSLEGSSSVKMTVTFPNGESCSKTFWEVPSFSDKSSLADQLASEDFCIRNYLPCFDEGDSGRELAAHYLLSGGWFIGGKVVSWTQTFYSNGHEYEGALGSKWDSGGETTERMSRTVIVIKSASGKSWREGHDYGVDSIDLPEELCQKFKSGVDITGEVQAYLEGLRAAGKSKLQADVQNRDVLSNLHSFVLELCVYSSELAAKVESYRNASQKVLDRVIAADMAAIESAFFH